MKKSLYILCLTMLSFSATGCIFRPAANTILSVKKENDSNSKIKIGFKTVTWSQTQNYIYVNGHGWHPKETQTYVFFWSEPYPRFQPREIDITFKYEKSKASQICIALWLDPTLLQCGDDCNEPLKNGIQALYTGLASCTPKIFLDQLYLDLKDVKLFHHDIDSTIIVSGKIVAVKKQKNSLC